MKTTPATVALVAALMALGCPPTLAGGPRSSVWNAQAQMLEDSNAVKKLQRAYGYYLDRGYWGQAADLFADNATFEWGMDGVYVGKARIREYLIRQAGGFPGPGLPYGQYNHHMQLQPVVQMGMDTRTASARWRELALIGQYKNSAEWGEGTYENTYVKENGVWKLKSLHFYLTFLAPYQGGWAKLANAPDSWRTQVSHDFPPDLPSAEHYSMFPAHFIPPFSYIGSPKAFEPPMATESPEGHRLAILRSHDDIENLQGLYGYYIDKGLWSKAVSLFASNGTYEYGQQGVYIGPTHIKAALNLMAPERLNPGQLNIYMMLQPIIDVAPDNKTAKARWRSDVMLAKDGKGEWGEGTYENAYVNVGGVWRIQSLHFYPTMLADYEKGWGLGAIQMERPSKEVPPDRPPTEIYQSFPSVYLPAYHYVHPVMDAPPIDDPANTGDPEVQALRRRITRLEDQGSIERLQRAYGYYVDKLQWPKVADLFTADGTLEIGGRGVFVGRPHILVYLQGLGETGPQHGLLMNHQQFQGIVDVGADGRTANGRWTAFVMAGKAPTADFGDVVYENRYLKEGGIWKIAALHAPFQMYSPATEGWGRTASPNTRPDSWAPPPDRAPTVTYNNYPSFYVEPYHYANPVTGERMPAPSPAAGGSDWKSELDAEGTNHP